MIVILKKPHGEGVLGNQWEFVFPQQLGYEVQYRE
jgi:hypothetical protein